VVIAIDGPGGVGKSTVARAVAARLGAAYLDTGALYRAVTLGVLRGGCDTEDPDAVVVFAESARFAYENESTLLDGEDVSAAIRAAEVNALVSPISAMPELRRWAVEWQREWVDDHGGDAVVVGRDIGTVVFPDAPVKVYLTADAETRARRRAQDPEAEGQDLDVVATQLELRDEIDSTRDTSPLKPAEDAVVIDTSALGINEVVAIVLALATDA
jgi:cytidylate kinase